MWLAAGFVALGVLLMTAVSVSVHQRSNDAVLRQSLEFELDLNQLLSALLDAEIGQRGYLLTGNEAFLAPYKGSQDPIATLLARLDRTVEHFPTQALAFRTLRDLVDRKDVEIARRLDLQRQGDASAALRMVRDGEGKALTDTIRNTIRRMDGEQDRIVAENERVVRAVGDATTAVTALTLVLMGGVAWAALSEVRKRERLSRFLPQEIASRLAAGDPALQGWNGSATIAFIDIRGSTLMAETISPADLSATLTTFRRAVTDAAREAGGMVDKFMGDGALVVFGALDGDASAPRRALAFAQALLFDLSSGPRIPVGIGLHHGDLFCGLIGDEERQEFTVVGDAVNIASRIEQATKRFGTDLLVSDVVLARAGADPAEWCEVSREPLRGRREGVTLFARRAAAPLPARVAAAARDGGGERPILAVSAP